MGIHSQNLALLKNRINLHQIPFSEGQLAAYRKRTLDLICCRADIYEYHHSLSGENPPTAASMLGWSPGVFVNLAIQATCEKSQ